MNKLNVAAYCRGSTNHEEQKSGPETQISYYVIEKLIIEHKSWNIGIDAALISLGS